MNEIVPFSYDGHQFRGFEDEHGEPWWVARDVCDILELDHISNALKCLDDDELAVTKIQSGGQLREMNLISESGLYTLILRSNKPQAKPFRKWVTSEVLPTIRKTGQYQTRTRPATWTKIAADFKACKQLALESGLKGNAAILSANSAIRAMHDKDPLAVLGINLVGEKMPFSDWLESHSESSSRDLADLENIGRRRAQEKLARLSDDGWLVLSRTKGRKKFYAQKNYN